MTTPAPPTTMSTIHIRRRCIKSVLHTHTCAASGDSASTFHTPVLSLCYLDACPVSSLVKFLSYPILDTSVHLFSGFPRATLIFIPWLYQFLST